MGDAGKGGGGGRQSTVQNVLSVTSDTYARARRLWMMLPLF